MVSSALLFLGAALFFAVSSEARPQLPAIPREFQNINFEQYLRNERAMKFQLKCIVYDGPCDTIGKFLKRNIPIYLRTQCRNCGEDQKKLASKFTQFLQLNYPTEWDDALAKYGKAIYNDEEIARFETELGIKIVRDKNGPTRAPGTKADIEGLVALAKEAKEAAMNTKEPLILGRKDSSTTVIVTLPAKFTTPASASSSTSKTSTTTEAPTTTQEEVGTTTSP